MKNIGEYCWYTDAMETFYMANSLEEAHGAAQEEIDDNYDKLDDGGEVEYVIAKTCNPIDLIENSAKSLAENILNTVDEWAHEEVGADDVIFDMSNEDLTKLGQIVLAFIKDKAAISYFGCKDKETHKYIIGSNVYNDG